MSSIGYLGAGLLTSPDDGFFTWSGAPPCSLGVQCAQISDGFYARSSPTASDKSSALTTDSLQWTQFDFSSIPTGSTINGIEAEDKVYASLNDPQQGYAADKNLFLRYDGSSIGSNMISASNWLTSPEVRTYGGPSIMWGTTLTRDQIASSTFGIFLQVSGNCTVYVEYFRIRVYFTIPTIFVSKVFYIG